ncbi:hypothetical protein ACM25O_19270 [Sulfitobacter pontiacus]
MLEDFDMRHRAEPRQLRHLGRDIDDHQLRCLSGKELRHCSHRVADAGPSNGRAVGGVGCIEQSGATRLMPPRLEQRGQLLHRHIITQRRENIVARAENSHWSRFGQGIDNGSAAFRMAPPLMMHEIAEGPQGNVRKIAHDYSPAISIGCGMR